MRPVEIFINARGNLGPVDAARKGMDELRGAISNVAGISIGVGVERAIEGIKEKLQEGVKEAIHFTAEMETAQYSIAAMQKQFAPGQFRDFQSALRGSADVIDVIKKKANEMNVSIEDAVETYKTSAGAMYAGGVRDLTKQVDLALMLQQAMRGLGVQGFQATRDIQDILTGRSHMTKAGRELGLSDESIKKAEEAGRLYEYLNEQLGAFAEAGKSAGGTLNAEFTRFNNTITVLGSELSQPMFEELKTGVAGLLQEIQKPEFREALVPMGEAAAEVAHAFFAGTKLAAEHAGVIMQVGKAFADLVKVVVVWKGLELGAGLVMLAAKWITTTGAIKLNTAALVENAAAAKAAQAAGGGSAAMGRAGQAGLAIGAAVGGWEVGQMIDYKFGSPFRTLARHIRGDNLGSSGQDDERAIAERDSLGKDQQQFLKQLQGVSSLDDRLKLEKELKEKIQKRQEASADAGVAERAAINDSVSALEMELRLVQRLTEEKLKHKKELLDAQAEVSRLIGAGTHFEENKNDTLNSVQGAITGVDAGEAMESTRQRLEEARKKTGIEDFGDFAHLRNQLTAVNARGDEITGALDKSNTAKTQQKAGEKFNAADILGDKEEEELLKERGQLAETLKNYKNEIAKGIAAQEDLRQHQVKVREMENERDLAAAKARHDGPAQARIEETMLRNKNYEAYRSLGDDEATARKKADEDADITRQEREASRERLEAEIKIAALRKEGHNEEARLLERDLLAKYYQDKFQMTPASAQDLADRKVASEKTQKIDFHREVDRFTRIGLFTGGSAGNPLESSLKEANDWLKKIHEKMPSSAVETGVVGDY